MQARSAPSSQCLNAQRVIFCVTPPLPKRLDERGKRERTRGASSARAGDLGTERSRLNVDCCWTVLQRRSSTPINPRGKVMQTIGLTALIVFGLGTSAMADEIVPEEYQGVWAAARDCKENFQNVISNAVNRESAACRVMQVRSSANPESHTSTIDLNCAGLQSREIWHGESVEGTDYLVIVQLEQGASAGRPSIDMYKRCPGIPLSEIPLSEIPGNPVVATASEEKMAPPPHNTQIVRQRPFPHARATRIRKHRPQ